MPPRVQLWIADAAAAIGWRLLPAMHGRVQENVRQILGPGAAPSQVEAVARRQWRNYLRYLRDFVALPHASQQEIDRILAGAEGWSHIVDCMDAGHGVVLVSAHFGSWDLAAGAMARHYPVNVIADTFSSPKLDQMVNKYRAALRLKVIPIEKALKRTLTALRRNEGVAFLVDKPIAGDAGVEVRFFGRPTRIPAGAAFFALKAGAPIVPAFVWRTADRAFCARVFPPIWLERSDDSQRDVRAGMQRVVSRLEEMIREQPENWYMFRRMWPSEPLAAGDPRPAARKGEAVA